MAQEDPQPAKCSWHATSPPADSSCPPLPPSLPQENPQFQPRLQEGISLGPFDAADEKWCKKAPRRSQLPAAVGYGGFMSLGCHAAACALPTLAWEALPTLALFPIHFLLSSSHWACQEVTFTPGAILLCAAESSAAIENCHQSGQRRPNQNSCHFTLQNRKTIF